jgi:hypothetical protein
MQQENVHGRGEAMPTKQFSSPEEELQYLRAQVAEKERRLSELGHEPEREALAHTEVKAYAEHAPHEVLDESHQMTHSEVEAIVLDLPPDRDDEVMGELLGVLQEKGIKNALTVAERLGSPHIEDDFHRVLVQYIAHGYQAPGIPNKGPLWDVLNTTLFEVTLPDPNPNDHERPLKELVSAMEQFYMGMLSMSGASKKEERFFTLEVAVSGDREDIVFYMAVPRDKTDLFEKQLTSVFPKARAHVATADYNVFLHDGATATATAQLTENAILPLKDYRDFDHDPLSVLISTFTKIAPVGEGAAVQLVVKPAGRSYYERYRKILEQLEKGRKLHEALREVPESVGETLS